MSQLFTEDEFLETSNESESENGMGSAGFLSDEDLGAAGSDNTTSDDLKTKPYWRLPKELASWACTSGSGNSLASLTSLCKILRPYGFKNLPSDARTLMHTPKETHKLIRDVFPGQYIHIGLQIGIEFQMKRSSVDISHVTEIVIDCDMDGVRICKNQGTGSFWPIWCLIREPLIGDPFLVGNYVGKGTPKDTNVYVKDFVDEFKKLMTSGLQLGDKFISVRFGRFVGDSPGRSDIFGLKATTGYYGCPRCVTAGSYHNNRICFTEFDAALRTDENFRSRSQPEHHKFTSLLESELGVKCIKQVPLDSMHLLYGGVARRFIFWLVADEVNFKFKLSSSQIDAINDKLEIAALSLPAEFSRPVKDIRNYKQFKCTQLRQFLLYLSIVTLKDVLPTFQYEHFLLLFVGVRILSDENQFILNNSIANDMLTEYAKILCKHFGKFRLIFSFHMLIHLADETLRQNEPLDRFAMWKFENANSSLKQFTRRQGAYLEQSYNRTIERYLKSPEVVRIPSYPILKLKIESTFDETANRSQKKFVRIDFGTFMLDTAYGNRWFLTKSGEIVRFDHVVEIKDKEGTQVKIEGRSILHKKNFFEKPCFSSFLNIYECCDRQLSRPIQFDLNEFDSKIFMIRSGEKMVFIPLLK